MAESVLPLPLRELSFGIALEVVDDWQHWSGTTAVDATGAGGCCRGRLVGARIPVHHQMRTQASGGRRNCGELLLCELR